MSKKGSFFLFLVVLAALPFLSELFAGIAKKLGLDGLFATNGPRGVTPSRQSRGVRKGGSSSKLFPGRGRESMNPSGQRAKCVVSDKLMNGPVVY